MSHRLPAALYVVSTPIGNLEDLSARAVRVLQQADVVACEDTRTSAPLLAHVGAAGKRVALHDHNEDHAAAGLVAWVVGGQSVALISDAGTPLISDPGHPVVAAAIAAGVTIVPVPGASAVLSALVGGGLPAARFYFVGFLPERSAKRAALLAELADLSATLVFYAPARDLDDVLGVLHQGLGDRAAVVGRELTKMHEEFARGTLSSLAAHPPRALGEAVILVAGAVEQVADSGQVDVVLLAGLAAGEAPSALAKRVARQFNVARSAVYERLLALKHPDKS